MSKAESQGSCEAENMAERNGTVTRQMLVRKYASMVLGFCLANAKNFQDGEDIMQEVFLKAFTKLDTLKDPSRVRSWLLGQKRPVTVNYLYYLPTMQEKAMSLMGSKLEASLAIEGKFSENGLLALTQGEDITSAMARALVDGLETEGLEQMWSKLNQANKTEYREAAPDGCLFYADPENFLKKRRTRRRRKKAAPGSEQLLLFSDL